jgi:hypothetical protein
MYELQRKQAQIEEFRRRIEAAKRTTDRDVIRQLIYQMSAAGFIPQRAVSFISVLVFVSPGAALSLLSSSFEASARRIVL